MKDEGKKYVIRYDMRTGNSFRKYEETGEFLSDHDDLGIAKENLVRIKQHYALYKILRGDIPWEIPYNEKRKYKTDAIKAAVATGKPWLVIEQKLYCISQDQCIDEKQRKKYKKEDLEYRADEFTAENYLKLLVDGGGEYQLSAPWCGYFETLRSVYIEVRGDDEMHVVFD